MRPQDNIAGPAALPGACAPPPDRQKAGVISQNEEKIHGCSELCLTNPASFVALRNLNAINRDLDTTQNRVSTGLKVTGAVEDVQLCHRPGIRGELRGA